MSICYEILIEDEITIINFNFSPNFKDIIDISEDIYDNCPCDLRLWNLSNVIFKFSTNELIELAEYGKAKFSNTGKAAFLSNNNLSYGNLRAFYVYRSVSNEDIMVFRSRDEAVHWLKYS